MDDDDSVCIIPDTPQDWRTTYSQSNRLNLDNSFEISPVRSNSEQFFKDTSKREQVNSSSQSNSPVFGCKRKLEITSGLGSNNSNPKTGERFSTVDCIPVLPGSSDFAKERALALKRKKQKDKLSPFTKSKYSLSPAKSNINILPDCSSQEKVRSNLKSRWSPSPLETNDTWAGASKKCSGFVKSSSLLGNIKNSSSTSSTTLPGNVVKSKKRKLETVTSNGTVANGIARPRITKQQAKYFWPSSSESSDDEIPVNNSSNYKRKKNFVDKSSATATNIIDSNKIDNIDKEWQCMVKSLPESKELKKRHMVPSSSSKMDVCNTATELTARLSGQKGKIGNKTKRKTVSGRESNLEDNLHTTMCDNYNDYHTGRKPAYKVSNTEKMTNFNKCIISRTRKSSPYNFHLNSDSTPGNNSLDAFMFNTLDSEINRRDPMTPRQKMSQNSQRNLTKTFHDSPRRQRPSTHGATAGVFDSIPGDFDNPIDIETATTPGTTRALEEIRRIQADEEFARKMQEELDLEFARSLQGSEEHTSRSDSLDLHRASSHIDDAIHHWHANSPSSRVRQTARRGGGRRRRGRGGTNMNDEYMHFLRETLYESDMNDLHNDTLFAGIMTPPRRRRAPRRGGRAGAWMLYSPDDEGEDYEDLMDLAEMLGEAKEKGLSKSELGRLPIVTYKKTATQEIEECNICMTDYEAGDSQKILPCFHTFHCDCIDEWVKKNATCPICRVEVKVNSP